MSAFTTLSHPIHGNVRSIPHNNDLYFVLSDVCHLFDIAPTAHVLGMLAPGQYSHIKVGTGSGYVINIGGVSSLAVKSAASSAIDIVGWLSSEVSAPADSFDNFNTPNQEAAAPATSQNLPVNNFTHPEFGNLDIVTIDGKEYFPAVECAKILGYSKPHNAISMHCRYSLKQGVPHPQSPDKSIEKIFIPEGDLYRLIVRSKLPAAEKFERWVFDEVLPSIRKHGAYMTAPVLQQVLQNPSSIIDLANALISEHAKSERLQQQIGEQSLLIQTQSREIEEMRPKVTYLDTILQSNKSIPVSIIAKDYGMSAVNFNRLLHDLGIQYKCGKTWLLYNKYASCGYTASYLAEYDGNPVNVHTNWTQKGRLFLYNFLKDKHGLVPLIERESA